MKKQKNSLEPVQLLGEWNKTTNEYINENSNVKLLIVNRKYLTENKPHRYILIKHKTEKREYLSGIFPTNETNKYKIDYKGKNYIVTFTESTTFNIQKS